LNCLSRTAKKITRTKLVTQVYIPFKLSAKHNLNKFFFLTHIIEQLIHHIQKRLTDAFEIFDGDKTRTVDAKFVLIIYFPHIPRLIEKLISNNVIINSYFKKTKQRNANHHLQLESSANTRRDQGLDNRGFNHSINQNILNYSKQTLNLTLRV
jgi:hypothetical protein